MEYFKNIWAGLYSTLVGMKITWGHMFVKKVTMQYPERDHPLRDKTMPLNARNRIFVDMDNCDGCSSCARACPVGCIDVEIVKVVPGDPAPPLLDGKARKTWVTTYNIDFAKCCFCSLCTEACPTNAIVMTTEFEYSVYDRKELLYRMSPLTTEEAENKKKMWAEHSAAKKKAEAEAKAAADAKAVSEA